MGSKIFLSEFMHETEFRTLSRFPNYRFGSDGSVWSRRNWAGKQGQLAQWRRLRDRRVSRSTHLKVNLVDSSGHRADHLVHRLVLEAFRGPCPPGLECRHGNDVGNDNRVDNLSWGTRSQNRHDCVRNGRDRSPKGEANARSKLTEEDVRQVRRRRAAGESQQSIADSLGVTQRVISLIDRNLSWVHVV